MSNRAVYDRVLDLDRVLRHRSLFLFGVRQAVSLVAGVVLVAAVACSSSIDPTPALDAFNAGDYEKAEQLLDAMIARDDTIAGLHLYRGRTLERRGRLAEALAALDRAIELDPRLTRAFVFRATLRSAEFGEHALALEDIQAALRLDPENTEYLGFRAKFHSRQKDFAAAARDYEEITSLDPDDATALAMRGYYKSLSGNATAGLDDLNLAIERAPESWQAYFLRGEVHGKALRYDQAIADYDKMIELTPPGSEMNAAAHFDRGGVYMNAGRVEEGLADFEACLQAEPMNTGARMRRAVALADLGRTAEACKDVEDALRRRHELKAESVALLEEMQRTLCSP